MRKILVVAAPLALGACGGPIELTVAKLAGDLISYVSTGKSTTDHAVSFVASQDCALHRPLMDQDICKDEEAVLAEEAAALAVLNEPEIKQEIRTAAPEIYAVNAPAEDWSQPSKSAAKSNVVVTTDLPPLPAKQDAKTRVSEDAVQSSRPTEVASAREQIAPEDVSLSLGDLGPIDPQVEADAAVAGYVNDAPLAEVKAPKETVTAALVDTTTMGDGIEQATAPAEAKADGKTPSGDDLVVPLPGDYVVLASFADEARAQKALGIYQEYQPRLLSAEVKGTPYLRVAVGPLTPELAHDLRLLAAKKGVKNPWIVGVGPTGE
ncbi:SPOR domain-containing protein [Thalassospira australica]|uniref:SPOR domain-containing protein n=1 Tax=Thalassospira australica TaxID=1528106 RepID=UPI001EE38771|nr:SPOR domain-containing protein [Thalassospira australica]